MSTTTTEGAGDWTQSDIAYCQIALTRDSMLDACAAIQRGDDDAAHEIVSSAIRQLQTAAGMLR